MKQDLIYEYLIKNCVGKENRKKSTFFMKLFDIANNKTFRYYIEKIRYNTDKYPIRVESVSGKNGGYYIAKRNEKTDTVEKFKQRTRKTALTASKLKKTPILGQIKMKFKEIFKGGK